MRKREEKPTTAEVRVVSIGWNSLPQDTTALNELAADGWKIGGWSGRVTSSHNKWLVLALSQVGGKRDYKLVGLAPDGVSSFDQPRSTATLAPHVEAGYTPVALVGGPLWTEMQTMVIMEKEI